MQFPVPGPNAFAQRAAREERDAKPLPASPLTPNTEVDTSPELDESKSARSSNGNTFFWQGPSKPSKFAEKLANNRSSRDRQSANSAGSEGRQSSKRQSPRTKQSPRVLSSGSGRVAFEGKNNEKLRQLIDGGGHVRTPSSSTRIANISKGKGRTPPPPPLNLDQSSKSTSSRAKSKTFFTNNFVSPKKNFFERLGLAAYRGTPEPVKKDNPFPYKDRSPGLPLKAAQVLGTRSLNSRHDQPLPSSAMIRFGELDLAGQPPNLEDLDADIQKLREDLPPTPSSRRLARETSEPRLLALNQRIATATTGDSHKNSPHTSQPQHFDHENPPTPPDKSASVTKEGQPTSGEEPTPVDSQHEVSARLGLGAYKERGDIVEAGCQDVHSVHGTFQEGTAASVPSQQANIQNYSPSIYRSAGLSPGPSANSQHPSVRPAISALRRIMGED